MPIHLRIAIFIVALALSLIVLRTLTKKIIPVKYSFLWWVVIIVLFMVSLLPDFLLFFVNLLGFQTTSNFVIGIFIVILLFITISLTVIVSQQDRKITLLIQEISILKQKMDL